MKTYAILNASAITAHGTPRQLWPDVSFPRSGPNAAFLSEQGAIEVRRDLPHDPETHYLQRTEPYLLDGVVYDRVAVERSAPERWQEFADALTENAAMIAMVSNAAQNHPVFHLRFGHGLSELSRGDSDAFMTIWTAARRRGLIAPAFANGVRAAAATFDLPSEFVAGLDQVLSDT